MLPNATEAGVQDPGPQQRPAPTRGSSPLWWVVAALLALVLVAGTAFAVWAGLRSRSAGQADEQRAAASTVAGQFALRMDKVDGTDFDGYIKSVNQLLTTKAKAKNDETFKVLKQSYTAAKVKGQGKLILTAVGDADADSATVLVVHDADVTTAQGDIAHHYRWSVDVVKVKGRWLVDDFNPVN